MTREIRELEPALLAPDAPVTVTPADGLVRAGGRSHRGRLAIIAVNAGYEPATATLTAPGLDGRSLRVVGTGQTVDPDGDSFTERFPPLAARVYVTALAGSH